MKTKTFSLQSYISIIFTLCFCLLGFLVPAQIKESENRELSNNSEKSNSILEASQEMDSHIEDYIDSLENILIICGFLAKDFEGNIYRTAFLGDQIWMSENLKSIKYSDGSPINGVYVYPDNEKYIKHYRRLYTWDAAMNNTETGKLGYGQKQGIYPTGWHIPSNRDWVKLINFLGGKEIAGGKLKLEFSIIFPTALGSDCITAS